MLLGERLLDRIDERSSVGRLMKEHKEWKEENTVLDLGELKAYGEFEDDEIDWVEV